MKDTAVVTSKCMHLCLAVNIYFFQFSSALEAQKQPVTLSTQHAQHTPPPYCGCTSVTVWITQILQDKMHALSYSLLKGEEAF